jgi:Colicin V production protein
MIDILCLAVVGVIVWCVSSDGIWGAAHTFLCVVLSGLLAMNFFEPLANYLDGMLGGAKSYSDLVALVGLFTAFVFALRMGTEQLSPTYIHMNPTFDQFGRWVFGALTGYVTMAILLTSLHTAPVSRNFLGFKPERNNFFGLAPDRQWLGFTQYVTEKPFARVMFQDPNTKELIAHAFDGKYEVLGDKSAPYRNTIWPSFPIRYAMRRDQLSGGGDQGSTPAPVSVQPVAPVAPAGGGAAAPNPGF